MSDTPASHGTPAASPATDRRAPAASYETNLLENMFAPELFATFASSFSVSAGSVTIKLVSTRWDNSVEPAQQKAVVVGRVTMPLQGAQTLAAGLQSFLAQHGLLPVESNRPRTRASDAIATAPNSVQP